MKTQDIWFNHGRWLARCLSCTSKNEIKPPKGEKEIKFYCGACYPGKVARVPKMLPTGEWIYGYDAKKQRRAAEDALTDDAIYTAVMPDGWEMAQDLLVVRKTPHQGFYPGNFGQPNDKEETIADLENENKNNPILHYLKKEDEKEDEEIPEEKKIRKKLTDKEYRSLQ